MMTTYHTLHELQTAMRVCQLCLQAGHAITPGAIFSGTAVSQVMLIGQAPGVTEGEAKRPFNASSGRRLFQWLGEAGWDEAAFRARQYMTAVTKCYPGKDKAGKGDRVPGKAEQALCRPFLEQEITFVQPRLLILVGGLAIKLLYPASMKLNEVVGTAVYFPPAALAQPVNFRFADGRLLASEAEVRAILMRRQDGRFVVPLPHPSGASLWPNKPANQALIGQAIRLLSAIREAWNLH